MVSYGSKTSVASKTILSSTLYRGSGGIVITVLSSGSAAGNPPPFPKLTCLDSSVATCVFDINMSLENPVGLGAFSSSKRNPTGVKSSVSCSSCIPSLNDPDCS